MATSGNLTYVTGVNAATNYVRVGHNSSAVNNDAVWSFQPSETGVASFNTLKFVLKWNNTSAGTGWSGEYTYVFAVTSSGSAGQTAYNGTVLKRTTVKLSGSSGTATVTISGLSLSSGTTYYLRANHNSTGSANSTMKAFQKASNTWEVTSKTMKTYTVSYNKGSNGTGTNTTATKTHGTALTLKGAIFTRTGYYQSGWSTTDGGAKDYNLSASYTSNAAVTLYPVWTAYKLTLKFHVNSGSITTGTGTTRYRTSSSIVQKSTDSGSTWANLTNSISTGTSYVDLTNVATYGATRTGYHVVGESAYRAGSTSGTIINQGTASSSDTNAATISRLNGGALTADTTVTLYINWVKDTYTITYKPGSYSSGNDYTATKTYGEALTLRGSTYTRTGYTQDGWSINANGSTKDYNLSASYTTNSAKTLYPHWAPITYTISYSLGGGTQPSGQNYVQTKTSTSCPMNPTTIAYDCSNFTPVDANHPMTTYFNIEKPVRTGYTFTGWNISGLTAATAEHYNSDGTWSDFGATTATQYNGSGAYRYLRSSAGTVTFTATWQRIRRCKVYSSGAWQEVPMKIYDGSAWQEPFLKIRDNNDWKI